VDGLGDAEIIRSIGQLFDLHPLALEDVLSLHQRPKVDDYDTYLYLVVRMLHYGERVETEQISLFLGPGLVLTFQEEPGDCLDPIRERIRKGGGRLRHESADYLLYAILDALVDNYFPFLEQLGEVLESLEDEVVANPTRPTLGRVYDIKRDLLNVRRSLWPLRDALGALVHEDSPLLGRVTRLYLRDCYDHTLRVVDIIETYRELAAGLMEVYLSSVSNKLNEVMKVLTVISTIFIPLTFIAGVYGMNFRHMPELEWPWGYSLVWGIMIGAAAVMLVLFRRKGWLGGGEGR
jgi:magnesium transporter